MIFKPEDIKYVKSVKREDGTDWAYYDKGMDSKFKLNFSDVQRKGAEELNPGEVILLFQRVNKVLGIRDHTYLTHLVTPIDNVLRKNEGLNHDFKWERKVAVVARANPRNAIYTIPQNLSFYKPNWGKLCDIQLLNSIKSRSDIQNDVWSLFKDHFNKKIDHEIFKPSTFVDDFSVLEGSEKEVHRKHIIKERNPVIIGIAKSRALVLGNGRITCECCNFDFFKVYGQIGMGFIECHHRLPIGTGGVRRTKPEHLAMVCSNCHRMLHKRDSETGLYLSVEELTKQLRIVISNAGS